MREGEDLHVLVGDHGIGIPDEALPRIFDEYFRTKEALRVNPRSTGLGLAIVKHIMDAHHGKVEVESEIGKGSKFTLWFSLADE